MIKRAQGFIAAGLRVETIGFRRSDVSESLEALSWPHTDLGYVEDRSYRKRLRHILAAMRHILRRRRDFGAASFLCARQLDLAILALFARAVSGRRVPFVYEVLDVMPSLLGPRLPARFLRWAERRVLARSDLLLVSSPGFVANYFTPIQGYRGRWLLIENKLAPAPDLPARPDVRPVPGQHALRHGGAAHGPWVIGWFGLFRCRESLRILCEVADALGPRVEIHLRGGPTVLSEDMLREQLAGRPNIVYGGPYRQPRDLAAIYGAVHFCWCFDLAPELGDNVLWLLPNRLYESGYFTVPSLAAAGTETGRRIEALGMGWTFAPPYATALIDFLSRLDENTYFAKRAAIARLSCNKFCDLGDHRQVCAALGLTQHNGTDRTRPASRAHSIALQQ